jgi:predicted negative regulator of RcsB-dependent stress response
MFQTTAMSAEFVQMMNAEANLVQALAAALDEAILEFGALRLASSLQEERQIA